jgi:hypothetical protein
MREEVTQMQRSIPCRRAVMALLAALVLAFAATPVVAAGDSGSTAAPTRYVCPPAC